MNARLFSFVGGVTGPWRVVNISAIVGDPLAAVRRLDIVTGAVPEAPDGANWVLRGLTSNERYVTRTEKDQLLAKPAVARRLHHCRDFGENEPFDFLTWFEFTRSDSPAFDELVAGLRGTEEWEYVEREIDIRVVRDDA